MGEFSSEIRGYIVKKLALAIICLSLVSVAHAAPKAGDSSVGIFGFAFLSDAADSIFIGTDYGHFYTDSLRANISVNGNFGDTESYTIAVGADWYMNSGGDAIPYVGATIGQQTSGAGDFTSYDLHIGMEQFLDERTSMDYRASYQDFEDNTGDGIIILQLGFKRYF